MRIDSEWISIQNFRQGEPIWCLKIFLNFQRCYAVVFLKGMCSGTLNHLAKARSLSLFSYVFVSRFHPWQREGSSTGQWNVRLLFSSWREACGLRVCPCGLCTKWVTVFSVRSIFEADWVSFEMFWQRSEHCPRQCQTLAEWTKKANCRKSSVN